MGNESKSKRRHLPPLKDHTIDPEKLEESVRRHPSAQEIGHVVLEENTEVNPQLPEESPEL